MPVRFPVAAAYPSGLAARLESLQEDTTALWHLAPADLPPLGAPTTWRRRWGNARAAARLIDDLAQRIDVYPEDAARQAAWREATCERLRGFGEERLNWPDGYRRLMFGDAFYQAAVSFAKQARAFDPALKLDDLWQAMRNVWIGNSLQMLLAQPVTLPPSLFAYSMLYPVTDNVLDTPDLSPLEKQRFNDRFGRRLEGGMVRAANRSEAQAFQLVGMIEQAFPRARCSDVWESVLAIHRGQVDSLRQQQTPALTEDGLVACTVAKGGASVLADLYLVAGSATLDEERFAFGYGVFLQLLDDVQDVEADLTSGHQTLVTAAAQLGPLDEVAARLVRFMDVVLERCPKGENAGTWSDCIDLIRRNCRSLLVGVIAQHPHRFSRSFRRAVEAQWPIGLPAMRRLKRRAGQRLQRAAMRAGGRQPVAERLLLD
jgi:hypothetical protein